MTARLSFKSGLLAASCALPALLAHAASAQTSGTLYVTGSTYAGTANTVVVGQTLPSNPPVKAIANGSYPGVFDNDSVDPNFGITSPILLAATPVAIGANGGSFSGPTTRIDVTHQTGIATSFPSKSELGIHLSTDGSSLTFTGYAAAINILDVSNANTLLHVDPTNTDTQSATYRTIIHYTLATGAFTTTNTNAYSGNNMRAAILANNVNGTGQNELLTVGNAGNGSGTEPTFIVNDTGIQSVPLSGGPATTVVGVQQGTPGSKNGFEYGFSVASIGDAPDKSGKDDNFRGEALFANTLYVTKGSGGNGVNTVYQVRPNGAAGSLPTAANASAVQVSILPGFPTNLAANISESNPATEFYPFGIWFANATTLYVADEGSQDLNADPNAGLQKWIFDGTKWNLAYTIQAGLKLDVPYSVPGYPTAYNPATTGLRHLTGVVSGGTVVLYATTATYSGLADPGADPNAVVEVTDTLAATTLPAADNFVTVEPAFARQVYRGVFFNPAAAQ